MNNETVLIVEDSPTQAEQLKYTLEKANYVVSWAKNGQEAVSWLETSRPTLLFSDVTMPGMSGFELCTFIKSNEKLQTIPVILLTSLSDIKDIIYGLKCGADSFISKPYKDDHLLAMAAWFVREAKQSPEPVKPIKITLPLDGEGRSMLVDPQRLVNLLFSSYQAAVHRNDDLSRAQETLSSLNDRLEELGEQRALAFDELSIARDRAESATRSKSEFLANMSHEIRTPLNAVIGFADLALKTDVSPKQADYLEKIHVSGLNLLAIINDILDFSKIEAGKLTLESIDFSVNDVVNTVVDVIGPTALAKSLNIIVNVPIDIPKLVIGDPLRLGQVLTNLMSNAVKFTERGDIELSVAHRNLTEHTVELRVAVRDTGLGLTPEQLGRLFHSFAQADPSTTRKFGGTGLGLSISKHLVELMGGEISIQSEAGKGTTVSFTTVFNVAAPEAYEPTTATATATDDRDLEGLNILLVEDNAMNQQIARELLESVGISVTVAGNGLEAVESLTGAPEGPSYDAVLMDIEMPEMDGYEATGRIREMPRYAVIPIIAMTAHAMVEERGKVAAAGMNAHVTKPIVPTALFQTLREWTKPRRTGRKGSSVSRADPRTDVPPIPGVNVQEGLARLGGNAETYLRLLREFPAAQRAEFEEIERALAAKDLERSRTLIHAVKGLAGNLSIDDLFLAAGTLEKALREPDWTEGLRQFESLRGAFDRFAQAIAMLNASAEAGAGRKSDATLKTMPLAQARGLLDELKSMVRANDAQSRQTLTSLMAGFSCPANCVADFHALEIAIGQFEFEQAMQLIGSIEGKLTGVGHAEQ